MQPDAPPIMNMANAFYHSCVLFTASEVGIFACLDQLKQATAENVSKHCNLNHRGTELLLDACSALQLLVKEKNLYRNSTEAAFYLVPGAPGDLSKAIRYNQDVYPAWGDLKSLVRTGKPVEKPELHLGDDKTRTRNFVLAMHGRALGIGQMVLPQLDFSGCKKILDVGGGPGTYSVLIAGRYPGLKSLVIDLPGVVAIASELIDQQGMSAQVSTLAGDYHQIEFPAENDAILFFGMLHQESPADIINLLKRAHKALNPGGKVWIMDMMTDDTHTYPLFSALFAVNMALTTINGWVFSDKELEEWFKQTGFSHFMVKALPQPMVHWLACAQKESV